MTSDALHDEWMGAALREAARATEHGDVPVGAIVADRLTNEIISARHNERELTGDPTAHAEVLALRDAASVTGKWRLEHHALVITLEPCIMCAGAIWAARIPLIVFGASDPKAGASGSLYNFAADPRLNHHSEVVRGTRADECGDVLRSFFAARR
jgi:tRNA(adenine34) deaminase